MFHEKLLDIPYDFEAGPLSPLQLMYGMEEISSMNCQRALQLFYYETFGLVLNILECLSAEGYASSGEVIIDSDQSDPPNLFSSLIFGDVMYARTLHCESKEVIVGLNLFQKLHVAVFLGKPQDSLFLKYVALPSHLMEELSTHNDNLIYHASFSTGKSEICSVQTFRTEYAFMRGKRILHSLSK